MHFDYRVTSAARPQIVIRWKTRDSIAKSLDLEKPRFLVGGPVRFTEYKLIYCR